MQALIGLKNIQTKNLFNADTKEPEPSVRWKRKVCIEVGVVISLLSLGPRIASVIER